MAEFPALPLWTDAYLGDTTHLTTIEHGAYLLLLMTAWRTSECALPDDDRLLARYARLEPRQWKKMRPIMADFFVIEDGKWRQRRLSDEREAVRTYRENQSVKGRLSAQAKALKNKGRHRTTAKSGSNSVPTGGQPNSTSLLHTQEVKPKDKSLVKKPLPDDWEPGEFGEATQSRTIVSGWSQLEFQRQLEAFRAHHRREGNRYPDWQAAWSTWVLNSQRFADRDADRGASKGNGGGKSLVDQVLEEKERQERKQAAAPG